MEIDSKLYKTAVKVKTDHPSLVDQLAKMSARKKKEADTIIEKFKEKAENRTWEQLIKGGTRLKELEGVQKGLWSVRFSRKGRLLVFPEDDQLVVYSIHPDHDSAYKHQ